MSKRKDKVEKKRGLGPRECCKCGRSPRDGPLPYGWLVNIERDAEYEKGYWMPVTCAGCREDW